MEDEVDVDVAPGGGKETEDTTTDIASKNKKGQKSGKKSATRTAVGVAAGAENKTRTISSSSSSASSNSNKKINHTQLPPLKVVRNPMSLWIQDQFQSESATPSTCADSAAEGGKQRLKDFAIRWKNEVSLQEKARYAAKVRVRQEEAKTAWRDFAKSSIEYKAFLQKQEKVENDFWSRTLKRQWRKAVQRLRLQHQLRDDRLDEDEDDDLCDHDGQVDSSENEDEDIVFDKRTGDGDRAKTFSNKTGTRTKKSAIEEARAALLRWFPCTFRERRALLREVSEQSEKYFSSAELREGEDASSSSSNSDEDTEERQLDEAASEPAGEEDDYSTVDAESVDGSEGEGEEEDEDSADCSRSASVGAVLDEDDCSASRPASRARSRKKLLNKEIKHCTTSSSSTTESTSLSAAILPGRCWKSGRLYFQTARPRTQKPRPQMLQERKGKTINDAVQENEHQKGNNHHHSTLQIAVPDPDKNQGIMAPVLSPINHNHSHTSTTFQMMNENAFNKDENNNSVMAHVQLSPTSGPDPHADIAVARRQALEYNRKYREGRTYRTRGPNSQMLPNHGGSKLREDDDELTDSQSWSCSPRKPAPLVGFRVKHKSLYRPLLAPVPPGVSTGLGTTSTTTTSTLSGPPATSSSSSSRFNAPPAVEGSRSFSASSSSTNFGKDKNKENKNSGVRTSTLDDDDVLQLHEVDEKENAVLGGRKIFVLSPTSAALDKQNTQTNTFATRGGVGDKQGLCSSVSPKKKAASSSSSKNLKRHERENDVDVDMSCILQKSTAKKRKVLQELSGTSRSDRLSPALALDAQSPEQPELPHPWAAAATSSNSSTILKRGLRAVVVDYEIQTADQERRAPKIKMKRGRPRLSTMEKEKNEIREKEQQELDYRKEQGLREKAEVAALVKPLVKFCKVNLDKENDADEAVMKNSKKTKKS
ncbi:unnamed protein product [Amoebophrya sp. A25]|nr:unnamed protein product [Amoebophrya sp. A25]|eukprot:GSA25T00009271001.1